MLRHHFDFVKPRFASDPPNPEHKDPEVVYISLKSIDAYQVPEPKITYWMVSGANKLNICKNSVIIRWCIQRRKKWLLQYSSYKIGAIITEE